MAPRNKMDTIVTARALTVASVLLAGVVLIVVARAMGQWGQRAGLQRQVRWYRRSLGLADEFAANRAVGAALMRTPVLPNAASIVANPCVKVVLSDLRVQLIEVLTAAEYGRTTTELAAATSSARSQPVVPGLTSLQSRQLVDESANSESVRVWTLTAIGRDVGGKLLSERVPEHGWC